MAINVTTNDATTKNIRQRRCTWCDRQEGTRVRNEVHALLYIHGGSKKKEKNANFVQELALYNGIYVGDIRFTNGCYCVFV
jgi:hypothetical protein